MTEEDLVKNRKIIDAFFNGNLMEMKNLVHARMREKITDLLLKKRIEFAKKMCV